MIHLITSFDASVLQWFSTIRTIGGSYFFIGVSEFAGVSTVLGITLIVALLLALRRRIPEIAGLVFTVIGSGVVVEVLKWLVHRPRPPLRSAAYAELGHSFPSGHATGSIALYLFLAFLLIHLFPRSIRRHVVFCFLILFPVLISFARIYLGVHYVSDVVAGMIIGAMFVWGGIMLTRRLAKKRK